MVVRGSFRDLQVLWNPWILSFEPVRALVAAFNLTLLQGARLLRFLQAGVVGKPVPSNSVSLQEFALTAMADPPGGQAEESFLLLRLGDDSLSAVAESLRNRFLYGSLDADCSASRAFTPEAGKGYDLVNGTLDLLFAHSRNCQFGAAGHNSKCAQLSSLIEQLFGGRQSEPVGGFLTLISAASVGL